MKLDSFLDEAGEKPDAFAARAGLSLSSVYRLINGEIWFGRDRWTLIVRATNRRVTPNDYLPALAGEPAAPTDGDERHG